MKSLFFMRNMLLGIFFCLSLTVSAQTVIKGTVISSADDKPVAGASVIDVSDPSIGTVTDADGRFTIHAKLTSEFVVSCMGYKTATVLASDASVIYIDEDYQALDELVVVGYTTEKKADITGAVAVVNMDDLKDIPTANVAVALQGKVPGVQIDVTGAPGGVGYSMLVRGVTTINDSSPLYVIDGIQTREHLSTILNPNDIESIQVLKDAASAAIYGTKASNGVVIITTKKGKEGYLNVDFSAQLTVNTVANRLEMLNAQEWGEVYWTASRNDGIVPTHPVYGSGDVPVIPDYIDTSMKQLASDTDWQKEGYRTSLSQNYNVAISNGNQRGSTYFSVNYNDDKGILKETRFKRFNVKLNSVYKFLNNRLRIGENMNLARYTEVLSPSGIHELLLTQHPLIPIHTEDGNWGGYISSLSDMNNPIRMIQEAKTNEGGNWRAFGNMFVEIEPLKNLVVKSNASIDYRNGFSRTFSPKWKEGDRVIDNNSLNVNNNYLFEWIWSNTVTYGHKFGKFSFDVLAGIEAKQYMTEWLRAKRENFLLQEGDFLYLDAGTGNQTNSNGATSYATLSQFGKINLNYGDRYLLSGTIRRDASSRFGKENNAGIFPSVSAGWRINNENFMKNVSWIDDLKIRASWGMNGNDMIDNEATYAKYYISNSNAAYDIGGTNNSVLAGVVKSRSENTKLKWEVTTQYNIGVDAAFLGNRLGLTFDWFNKDTDDMLIDRPYIGVIGEGGTYAYNGASMNTRGFETMISWRDHVGDFRYEVSLNLARATNMITSLPEDIYYTWGGGNGVDKSIVGQPLGSWFGYVTDGLFRTEGELYNGIEQTGKGLGRIRYKDLYEDNVINDKDRDWLGSSTPKIQGGLNISMAYKGFDLSLFFNGMVRDVWNNSKYYTDFFHLWLGNHGKNLLNAWDQDKNFNSDIPAASLQDLNNEGRGSTYFIEDGSFLKLKNLQIGYSLPEKALKACRMKSARIYLQAQNVFTITNYTGVDPECLGYNYPIPRTFTLGLNFGF